jgi:hypothetical protein
VPVFGKKSPKASPQKKSPPAKEERKVKVKILQKKFG